MRAERPASELHVIRGASMAQSPRLGVFTRSQRNQLETLYALVDSPDELSDSICRLVLRAVEQEFRATGRSLTSTLLQAIQSAHRALKGENRRALLEFQVGVGLTCALQRGDEVYVAQAGPTAVFCLRQGYLTPVGDTQSLEAGDPLVGIGDEPGVTLQRYLLQRGEGLLIVSAVVGSRLAAEPPTLPPGTRSLALDQLRGLAGPNVTFSALLITPPYLPAPAGEGDEGGDVEGARSTVGSARAGAGARSAGRRRPAPGASSARPGRPAGARSTESGIYAGDGITRRTAGSSFARLARPNLSLVFQVAKLFSPQAITPSPRLVSAGAASVARLPWPSFLSAATVGRFLRLYVLPAMGLVAALALMAAAWYLPGLVVRPHNATPERIMESAEGVRLRALATSDRGAMRRDLLEADRLVGEVLSRDAAHARAQSLKVAITADLARLDAVYRISDLRPLAAESDFQGGVRSLGRLVVAGGEALVLDRGGGKLHRFALSSGRDGLEGSGPSLVGAEDGPPLLAAARVPQGGVRSQPVTVALDADRNLWTLQGDQKLERLGLRGARDWASFQALRGYDGNLYVLDAQSNQVWRYLPTADGYNSEMIGLLERASIGDAVDLAIDGNVYVLTAAGQVWKFVGGRGQALPMAGIDRELSRPSAIFADRAAKFLYVADTGNRRVVVLDKNGNFHRQLPLADGVVPQDLYVNEAASLIYLLGEKALYVASLP